MKSRTKKKFNIAATKKSFIKVSALLVIVALNWVGLSAIGTTVSTFNDIENAEKNGFQAGLLIFL